MRSPRLVLKIHYLLPVLLFILYSFPSFFGGDASSQIRLFSPDRLEHGRVRLTLAGDPDYSTYNKYGIGAHLLDWLAVETIAAVAGKGDHRDQYDDVSLRYSIWYHRLLVALSVFLFYCLLELYIGRRQALAAAALFGIHPYVVIYAQTPCINPVLLFFSLASLVSLERMVRSAKARWAVLLGLASACAFVNKEFFGLMMLAYPVIIWEGAARQGRRFLSPRVLGLSALSLAAFLIAVCLLSLVWMDPQIYLDHWRYWLSESPKAGGMTQYDYWRHTAQPLYRIPLMIVPGIALSLKSSILTVFACIGLYFILIPGKQRIWSLMLTALPYFLFVSGRLGKLSYPYLLLVVPAAMAAAWLGWLALYNLEKPWLRLLLKVALCMVCVGYATFDLRFFTLVSDRWASEISSYFNSIPQDERFTIGTFERSRLPSRFYGGGSLVLLDERALMEGGNPEETPDFLLVYDPWRDVTISEWRRSMGRPAEAADLVFGESSYALVRVFKRDETFCVPPNPITRYVFWSHLCTPDYYLFKSISSQVGARGEGTGQP